jgi:hypothetical protein
VFAISGWMPPWFHANVWFDGGGTNTHGLEQFGAPAKKKYSPRANIVNVGVRRGSVLTMCSAFSSTGSASRSVSGTVVPPFTYGSVAVSAPTSRSSLRTAGSLRSGWPLT